MKLLPGLLTGIILLSQLVTGSVYAGDAGKPLVRAVRKGEIEKVQEMIARKVDVNVKDHDYTPLLVAVEKGRVNVVRLLLKSGADPNIKSYENTPLMIAASDGRVEIVKILLDAGAKIDLQNDNGFTALMMTSITWRAGNKRIEVIRLLLERGAGIDFKSRSGEKAIDIAKRKGNAEIVKILQKNIDAR